MDYKTWLTAGDEWPAWNLEVFRGKQRLYHPGWRSSPGYFWGSIHDHLASYVVPAGAAVNFRYNAAISFMIII